MGTTAPLVTSAILALPLLAVTFVAIVTSFWPEKVFKRSELNWWRRALLAAAVGWALFAVAAAPLWDLPLFAAFRPKVNVAMSGYIVGIKLITAIIILLPLVFSRRLREAIDLRVRWSWIALMFLPPLLIESPSLFALLGRHNWSKDFLFLCNMMLTGLAEETLFRGYAFQLRPEKRARETIIVTSIVFASMHIPTLLDHRLFAWRCSEAFFFAIGLGVVRLSTRSIGLSIVIHGLVIAVFHPTYSLAYQLAVFVLAASATAALFSHPSCRRNAEQNGGKDVGDHQKGTAT